jgi:hypothetical protein
MHKRREEGILREAAERQREKCIAKPICSKYLFMIPSFATCLFAYICTHYLHIEVSLSPLHFIGAIREKGA